MKLGTFLLRMAYAAVMVIMIAILVRQRETIHDVLVTVDPFIVAIAALVLLLYRVVNASIWGAVLNGLGGSVSYLAATRVWLTTEALRWLPGGIWGFCSRVSAAKDLGLSKSLAGLSLSVELVITILAWGLTMAAGFLISGMLPQILAVIPMSLVLLGIGGGIGLLVSLWLARRRILSQPWVQRWSLIKECRLRWKTLTVALFSYVILCATNGVAFYLLLQAFPQGSVSVSLFAAIGINAAGWLAGFFAIGAPGGLGAREAVLGAMLVPFLDLESVVLCVAAWRLLQMVVEAVTLTAMAATPRKTLPVNLSSPAHSA